MASKKSVNPRKQWLENFKKFKEENHQEHEFIGGKLNKVIQDLREKIPKETMDEFEKIKSDEERMSFLLKLDSVKEMLQVKAIPAEKSALKARLHREDGNKLFQRKSYRQAVEKYNEAIMQAPWRKKMFDALDVLDSLAESSDVVNGIHNGLNEAEDDTNDNQVALSFANRSAALFHMKQYDMCLRDIEEALSQEYPEELQYKLYDRKGKCFYMKKDKKQALENFLRTKELLESAKLDDKGRKLWINTVAKQIKQCDLLPDSNPNYVSSESEGIPKVSGELHSTFTKASKAINLQHNGEKGRHFKAESNIHVGDVMASEQPYSTVVYPEYYKTHCYHCCKRLLAPLPCQETQVVFCSKECCQLAWGSYHKAEYPLMSYLDHSWCGSIGIGALVVRTMIVTGFETVTAQLAKAKQEINEDPLKKGLDENGHYSTDQFSTLYLMEANLKERTPESLFDFAVYAAFLLKILQSAKFFGDQAYDECAISSCILHLLEVIQCNAYPVFEVYNTMDFENLSVANIGLGLYPTAALFNHSCDPNCDLNFYDGGVVVRATRNILKGEEITIDYADQVFYKIPLHSRRARLQFQYSFMCKCQACEADWPLGESLPGDMPEILCTDCHRKLDLAKLAKRADETHVRCQNRKCNSLQDLKEGMERLKVLHDVFAAAMEDSAAGRFKEAIPKFQDYLILMQKYISPPWRYITACQAAIRHCYRILANSRW